MIIIIAIVGAAMLVAGVAMRSTGSRREAYDFAAANTEEGSEDGDEEEELPAYESSPPMTAEDGADESPDMTPDRLSKGKPLARPEKPLGQRKLSFVTSPIPMYGVIEIDAISEL